MNSSLIQLLVLAAIAVFLVMRLRNVLGTRDGYEPPVERTGPTSTGPSRDFEVIEGGPDPDIADHVDPDGRAGQAFAAMKRIEGAVWSTSNRRFIEEARPLNCCAAPMEPSPFTS